jgi:aryl-alcohol dehydrogenase-like predicted oxidoreductase
VIRIRPAMPPIRLARLQSEYSLWSNENEVRPTCPELGIGLAARTVCCDGVF